MKQKKELPVLANFPYDPIGSFRNANPYTICFCYTNPMYKPNVNGEFIVKGGYKRTSDYIKKLGIPLLVFTTFWRHGRVRHTSPTFVNFKNFSMTGETPHIWGTNWSSIRTQTSNRAFYRNYHVHYMQKIWLTFRRIPRKWIPEYDEMIMAKYPGAQIHLPLRNSSGAILS